MKLQKNSNPVPYVTEKSEEGSDLPKVTDPQERQNYPKGALTSTQSYPCHITPPPALRPPIPTSL